MRADVADAVAIDGEIACVRLGTAPVVNDPVTNDYIVRPIGRCSNRARTYEGKCRDAAKAVFHYYPSGADTVKALGCANASQV